MINGKVQDVAFLPRNIIDDDGLSFYRLDFITAASLAEKNEHKLGVYYAHLKASDLLGMRLTLKPSPDELPGHVVIPEMTYPASRADGTKQAIRDWAVFLKLHANNNPLWGPSPPRPAP